MGEFCDYLKEATAKCDYCNENKYDLCTIKLGLQPYYAKFKLYDTIHILRTPDRTNVETDIEVTYKTKYPYGIFAGKGKEFAIEEAEKEKALRDYLEPKLPLDTKITNIHRHYYPDRHDPEIAAFHIHAYKRVEDLDEAKLVAEKLAEVIKPREIEQILEGEK